MSRRMKVVPYSPVWPRQYEQELVLLQGVLGPELVRAHHIGSTSVPGLMAKPVIDILLEVRSVYQLDTLIDAMANLGYHAKGEFGIPGRRYFPKGGEQRTHHVHAFETGDAHVFQHLVFRDYLREHPDVRNAYAAVKLAAAAEHETDPAGYVAFKCAFVEKTLAEAVHWARKEPQRNRNRREGVA